MKLGEIIEYLENRKIVSAVILKVDEKKIKILSENGREIKLSLNRILNSSNKCLCLAAGKTQLLESISKTSIKRNQIAETINVESIWTQLNKNLNWIEVKSIAQLYFLRQPNEDEESAIIRALFNDKLYFKFKPIFFYPNSKERINKLKNKIKKIEYDKNLITKGSDWIRSIMEKRHPINLKENSKIKNILSSFYIFGKASSTFNIAKKILALTTINSNEELFNFLVRIDVWDINVNIELLRFKTPTIFSHNVIDEIKKIKEKPFQKTNLEKRIDFTNKFTLTIDGNDTLDFDDALSIEKENNNYLLGIHISDVAYYVKRDTSIDLAASGRICSIYTPDTKIPMIPTELSEDICALKKDTIRPVISTMIKLNANGNIIDYNIYAATIKINKQLTYNSANELIQSCDKLNLLYKIAKNLRELRVKNGATQILFPELKIKIKNLKPTLKAIKNEAPSQILVSEMMILSNSIAAQFLAKHNVPAIFRSQSDPRLRISKKYSNSIYHNWLQKKTLKKLFLSTQAKRHSILGLNSYVTASSPIRKYSDLVTQRQIRSVLKIDQAYTSHEISMIIQALIKKTANISMIQTTRKRYWLLKYLEDKIGKNEEALILQKRPKIYNILLKAYMLECNLEQSEINLEPEDQVQVTIQYVNARKGVISVLIR